MLKVLTFLYENTGNTGITARIITYSLLCGFCLCVLFIEKKSKQQQHEQKQNNRKKTTRFNPLTYININHQFCCVYFVFRWSSH